MVHSVIYRCVRGRMTLAGGLRLGYPLIDKFCFRSFIAEEKRFGRCYWNFYIVLHSEYLKLANRTPKTVACVVTHSYVTDLQPLRFGHEEFRGVSPVSHALIV